MTLSAPVLSLLDATPDDMSAVLRIYTHHVLYGAASFEEQPPTLTEMQLRLSKVREAGLPRWWRKAKAVLSATAMPRRIAPAGLSLYRGRLGIYRRRATGQRRRQGAAERADRPLRARSTAPDAGDRRRFRRQPRLAGAAPVTRLHQRRDVKSGRVQAGGMARHADYAARAGRGRQSASLKAWRRTIGS